MLPPSVHTFFESFQNFTTYYIVVAIVGLVLLGILIWGLMLIKKADRINDSLQTKLIQLHKEFQQPCTCPKCGYKHSHEFPASLSGNNQEAHDNGDVSS